MKMLLSIKRLLTVAAFAMMSFVLAGCPEDGLEVDPPSLHLQQNGIEINAEKTTFAHEVGKTECPQKIGVIKLSNISGGKVRWTIERDDRIGTGAVTPSALNGNIDSGGNATIELAFNCTQTTDVAERYVVRVFDESGKQIADSAINVKGEVWMN
jgi:hypothetical protein